MHDDLTYCCDPLDAVHPDDGTNPAQPPPAPGLLGASPLDTATGTPPMIGRRLTIAEWDAYIDGYVFPWREPAFTVLHHTFRPDETTWAGITSMRSMQRYYAGLGWTSAPHIYCAPDGIWLFTPLDRIGIHAGRGNGSVSAGWYSVGVEMVGYFDRKLPSGPVWANTLAVLRGLRRRVPSMGPLAFHRDYSDKTCPGTAVTKEWAEREMTKTTTTQPPFTVDQPIMGGIFVPAALLDRALQSEPRISAADREQIVSAYTTLGAWTTIGNLLPFAQGWHETGRFTDWKFTDLRNPAGLGSTDRSVRGHAFPTIAAGIAAQYAHLLCYAAPPARLEDERPDLYHLSLCSPRRDALAGAHGLGCAPTWRGLGARWAVSPTYPDRVIDRALRIYREFA